MSRKEDITDSGIYLGNKVYYFKNKDNIGESSEISMIKRRLFEVEKWETRV